MVKGSCLIFQIPEVIMNKLFSFCVLILVIIASAVQPQYPSSFLNVHCEPHNAHLFPRLAEMVQLADSFGISLNIQFTPQWGSDILDDSVKIDKVRQWQINGHEIGAHHHGIEAGSGWDGYTSHPPENWTHPGKHLGDMQDYMQILNQVAGDSLVLNGGFGDTYDWPPGLLFRTEVHIPEQAKSQPVYENLNVQDIAASENDKIMEIAV